MATSPIDFDRARGDALFARVGAFLTQHRLSPEPAHYAFAYEVVANGGGAVARQVAELTEGGFRLCAADIVQLGGTAVAGRPVEMTAAQPSPETVAVQQDSGTAEIVERALSQLDGFAETVRAAHDEANDFGRDLAASAEAIRIVGPAAGVEEITRLTGAMLGRVTLAEERLASARRESDELRAALEEAQGSARTDTLTELPNRRAFDEAFAGLPPEQVVTVAICDIDHFKRVNDQFGHEVGDRVLKVVAQALTGEGLIAARYGGEEFALLFTHADVAAAERTIGEMREALSARRLKVRETGEAIGTVTFSAGVASGTVATGRAALMRIADGALYAAKKNGRDRTIIAP